MHVLAFYDMLLDVFFIKISIVKKMLHTIMLINITMMHVIVDLNVRM